MSVPPHAVEHYRERLRALQQEAAPRPMGLLAWWLLKLSLGAR